MKTKRHTSHGLRRVRRKKLALGLVLALVVGLYFVLKVVCPTIAGLLDGVFASVCERVGRKTFVDEG
jgi:hypothetical protein